MGHTTTDPTLADMRFLPLARRDTVYQNYLFLPLTLRKAYAAESMPVM
jgi:hypothetical protein